MNSMESKGQPRRKIGALLVDEGLVNPEDVQRVLSIQETRRNSPGLDKNRLFGMILCDLNLITPTDNYCVLEKHGKLVTLQNFLIQQQILPQSSVEKTWNRSIEMNIPLMSLLLEEKLISKPKLQQIVFDLFYIPFRSISDIIFDSAVRSALSLIINKEMAREYRVIPLVLKGNTLVCGITDPDNLVFIRNLNNQFPQYRFKPLFIPFSGFTWFYKMLYEEAWTLKKALQKPVDLLLSFCVSITDPGRQEQAITSLYKRYEWVRQLLGYPAKGNRAKLFQTFVAQSHERLTREYDCTCIEFSLKNETQLQIMAAPKDQE
jgi:MshEN domain